MGNRMQAQGSSNTYNIENTLRDSDFANDLSKLQSTKRGNFGWLQHNQQQQSNNNNTARVSNRWWTALQLHETNLEHNGAASGQSRSNLPGGHQQGIVPRDNQANNSNRLISKHYLARVMRYRSIALSEVGWL
jgi:ATP-dependent helicase YprA (DUF1998 family)